jgi:hypothetical protein
VHVDGGGNGNLGLAVPMRWNMILKV